MSPATNTSPAARQQGFSMMEIIVALSIIAVMAAAAMPIYRSYTANAQATEIVMLFDELRSGLQADFQGEPVNECSMIQQRAGGSGLLTDHYARVSVDFNAAAGGYKPALLVNAEGSRDGDMALAVAESVYNELSQAGRVAQGAVITDSIISFTASLSDRTGADCLVAVRGNSAGQTAASSANSGATQNPPASSTPTPAAQTAAISIPTRGPSQPDPLGSAPNCRIEYDAPVSFADAGFTEFQGPVLSDDLVDSRSLTGSQCVLCGDMESGTPCTELDAILGVTNKCPDTHPFCMSSQRVNPAGNIDSFNSCVDGRTADAWPRNNPVGGCYFGTPNGIDTVVMPQTPGLVCHRPCYGDGCNIDTVQGKTPVSAGLQDITGHLVCD